MAKLVRAEWNPLKSIDLKPPAKRLQLVMADVNNA